MYSVSNINILTAINGLGTDFVTAWSGTSKIDCIFWMLITAFGQALLTVIGQNYGARKYDRVSGAIRACLLMSLIMTTVVGGCMILFGKYMMMLFVNDPNVIRIGANIFYFFSPCYYTYICIEILASSLRGMGDSLPPALIILIGICVLRVLWVWFGAPLVTVWPAWIGVCMSYAISWIVTSLCFFVYFPIKFRKLREGRLLERGTVDPL
jgi:Na+-driven multidrug efflux pump